MSEMKPYIEDVYPMKAQYLRNQSIEFAVEVNYPEAYQADLELVLEMNIYDLTEQIETIRVLITGVHSAGLETIQVHISPKDAELKGYGVDVHLLLRQTYERLDTCSSSFDVVSNWRQSPRYGFLSDFHPIEKGDALDVKLMSKLHLNLVQFYDWAYRHDDLVSDADEYSDLMGKVSSLRVIREKIALCHERGMKAIGYGAVYAASKGFYEQHPDWALYDSEGKVLDFIQIFIIMNIVEQSPWHHHIIEQYKRAIELLQFDGIHMDTYGSPKTAISKLMGQETIVRLEEHFPVLINHTRQALQDSTDDLCLIFNNVGNWPVDTVARADQDVIYIEVWKPYERYHHIGQIISRAQAQGEDKAVILAAYLKPFMQGEDKREEANNAALLLTAVITAHGGYHLLLGEHKGVLTQGYYVDYSTLSDAFLRTIRTYYDFIIRYVSILLDRGLRDVSMTHVDGDNQEYVFEDGEYSTYGEAGKVWTIVREKPGIKVINLINLCGVTNDYWNLGKETPNEQNDLTVRIMIESDVKSIFAATPDREMGRPQVPSYRIESGYRGKTLVVKLDKLSVWTLLVVELKIA